MTVAVEDRRQRHDLRKRKGTQRNATRVIPVYVSPHHYDSTAAADSVISPNLRYQIVAAPYQPLSSPPPSLPVAGPSSLPNGSDGNRYQICHVHQSSPASSRIGIRPRSLTVLAPIHAFKVCRPSRSSPPPSQAMFISRVPFLVGLASVLGPLLFWRQFAPSRGCGFFDAVPPRRHPLLPSLRPRRSPAAGPARLHFRTHASPDRHQPKGGSFLLPRTLTADEAAAFLDVALSSSSPQPCSSFSISVVYSGPCLSSSSAAQAVSLPLWLLFPLVASLSILLLLCVCLRRFLRCRRSPVEPSPIPLQLFPPSHRLPHPALFHRPLSCPADIRDETAPAPVLHPPRSASLTSISPGSLATPPTARNDARALSLSSVTETSRPLSTSLLSSANPFW
ncbi:unnamed protein product [Cyprideis torosa]|uniref:Uncharacterized protein n=1 Tax=Cyprideis torosa TaxID=163714 RepID=A0A7R8WKR9_9CRUS|nr:unnamed protein product [Cyprideis torosa]CAG0897219.1 unnamed protein product [Cyprideis torosa]